jgi:hypothetical protein
MYGRISFLRNTKRVGDISEAKVLAAFVEAGYFVSIPFGENQLYDLVVEMDDCSLARVQIKTGRLREGAIIFNCYSSHAHRNGPSTRRYTGQVEYFGVYCPETDDIYLIPVDDVPIKGCLRVEPTRNNQRKKVRWASEFRLRTELGGNAVGLGPEGGVTLFGWDDMPL